MVSIFSCFPLSFSIALSKFNQILKISELFMKNIAVKENFINKAIKII